MVVRHNLPTNEGMHETVASVNKRLKFMGDRCMSKNKKKQNALENNNEIDTVSYVKPWDLFVTDADFSSDILKMSDFLDIGAMQNLEKMKRREKWQVISKLPKWAGDIASIIKFGVDWKNMGTLVADLSKLSKDVAEGLADGRYIIGESRKDSGNTEAVIRDAENSRIVSHITLRKALNPSQVLSDIQLYALRCMLTEINEQLILIKGKVNEIAKTQRNTNLHKPFLNARDLIRQAKNEAGDDQLNTLKEANIQLIDGTNSIRLDIKARLQELVANGSPLASLNTVEEITSNLGENFALLMRYIGLRYYLLMYLGKEHDAKDLINDFRVYISELSTNANANGLTAFELMHSYIEYSNRNVDYWLEMPKQLLGRLDAMNMMLESSSKNIILIEME